MPKQEVFNVVFFLSLLGLLLRDVPFLRPHGGQQLGGAHLCRGCCVCPESRLPPSSFHDAACWPRARVMSGLQWNVPLRNHG